MYVASTADIMQRRMKSEDNHEVSKDYEGVGVGLTN
jgi:hypothetical protein